MGIERLYLGFVDSARAGSGMLAFAFFTLTCTVPDAYEIRQMMRCSLAERAAKSKLERGAAALREVAPSLVSEDVEGIHGARVASRRLRAVIGAHRDIMDKSERRTLASAVQSVTAGLGVARELDVTIELLNSRRMGLSGAERYACTHTLVRLRALRKQECDAISASANLIVSEKFEAAVGAVVKSVRRPKHCYLTEAQKVLRNRRRELWRAQELWIESPAEETLHRVRIAFKKLRYACEQYGDLYGKELKRFVKALRGIQDDLGIWNDFRVARGYVLTSAEGAEPMAASGIAPLAELLDGEAAKHLDAYRTMSTAFFSGEHRDRLKRIFKDVKAPCCRKRKKGWFNDE